MTLLIALGSIGLVLGGLRLLMNALDEPVLARMRTRVADSTSSPARAFGSGFAVTVFVQASSITVIGAMALVERGLLGLAPAIYVMLGATLGTTLKALLFTLPFHLLGPIVIGLSSVGLVFARRYTRRKGLELAFALGVVFFGWHLGATVLPELKSSGLGWVSGLDVSSLPGLMFTIAVGFVVTALLQSSSTVVYVVVGVSAAEGLSVPVAAALVLGANVGTTVTPLLASLEYQGDVRRLAMAHLFVKAVGVAIVGLFFHTFLSVVAGLTVPLGETPGSVVALVHTVFNALNVLLWLPLVPLLARVVGREAPVVGSNTLQASVRRLLAGVPDEALDEVQKARDASIWTLKVAVDEVIEALVGDDATVDALGRRHDLRAQVLAGEEMLAAISVRDDVPAPIVHRLLGELATMESVLAQRDLLLDAYEAESSRFRSLRRERLGPVIDEVRSASTALWTPVLTGLPRPQPSLEALAMTLHRAMRAPGLADGDVLQFARQVRLVTGMLSDLRDLEVRVDADDENQLELALD